jgi:phage/plasmid-like protein (TIGR03299 family)
MAHGITNTDKITFTGEIPWHGLGLNAGAEPLAVYDPRVLDTFAWRVDKRAIASVRSDTLGTQPVHHNGFFALVREDTDDVLGTVQDRYDVFQNLEALDFAAKLGLKVNVAGTLWRGRKCFLDLDTQGAASVKRADGSWDPLTANLLFSWGHGGEAIKLCPAITRTVCHNTLTGNLTAAGILQGSTVLDHERLVYSIRHTSGQRAQLEVAAIAIRAALRGVHDFALVAEELDRKRFDVYEADDFLAALLFAESDDPEEARGEARAHLESLSETNLGRAKALVEQIEGLFSAGIGNQGTSAYDALNAVTEWIDHQRRRKTAGAQSVAKLSSLTESAWYGDGAEKKRRALQLLTRW